MAEEDRQAQEPETTEEAEAKAIDKNVGGGVDRDKLKDSDFVFSDERKFPVVTPGDVSDAVSSWGRYKGPRSFEEFKRRLIALCKRKGKKFVAALPEAWDVGSKAVDMAVKFLREQDDGAVVGGYIAVWGDPEHKDLQDDYFTPDTALWLDHYKTAPALFHHGLDETIDLAVIGKRVDSGMDEIGAWVEDWLDTSSKYWVMVKPLLDAKALYYSPGSASHLVRREGDGRLKSYPIVEDTLTVIPAQHRLRPIEQIKAAYKAAGLDFPEAAEEGGDDGGPSCQEADATELAKAKARATALRARIKRTMEGS